METNTPPTNSLHNPSENPFSLPPVEQATITESILDPDVAPPAKPAAKRRRARAGARARTAKGRGVAAARATKLEARVTMPSHGPVDLYDHAALWCERAGAVLRRNVLNLSVAAVLVVVLIAANWATQQPGDVVEVAQVTTSEPAVAAPTVAPPAAAPTLTASAEAVPATPAAVVAAPTAVEAAATLPAPLDAAPSDTAAHETAAAENTPSTTNAKASVTIPAARVETSTPGNAGAMVAVTVTASLNPTVASEAVASVPAPTVPAEPVAIVTAPTSSPEVPEVAENAVTAPAATPEPEPVAAVAPVVVVAPTPEAPVAQSTPLVAQKKLVAHHRVVARRHLQHPAAPLAKKIRAPVVPAVAAKTPSKKSVLSSEDAVFTSGGTKDLDNPSVRKYYQQQNQKLATRHVITVPAVNAPSPAANASSATNTATRTKP